MRHLMTGVGAAILAVTALTCAPPHASAATAATPSARFITVPPLTYRVRTLANGLKLYAMRDPKAASVTVDVWYGVGARDDPRGRSGFAHLFEHMMFRDTRDLSASQSEALIADAGGRRNGSTLPDYTNYTTTVPANHLEQALWLEGERLSGLVIDQAAFETERHIVEEEIRQRVFAQPYGRILYMLMPLTVYHDHPYGLEVVGSNADLDSATAEDARAFHEAYYRPDNAAVVVSGDFTPAVLARWADRYLGTIPKPARPLVKDHTLAPEGAIAKTVIAYAPNVPQPAVIQVWHAPRAGDADFAAAEVLEYLLGEGRSSRLYRALVQTQGLASRVYVSNNPAVDGGMFAPTVILASGKTVPDADAALSAEIARLRDEPVPAAELDRVKNQLLADALRDRETASSRAWVLGEGAGPLSDPGWSDRMLATVRALTPTDLQRVARRYLAENRRVDIHYLDESQRASGPPETFLGARPVVNSPPPAPILAPVALLPEAERQRPPQAAPTRMAQAAPIAERTLANGLKVVVVKSTDVPLVSIALEVGAGSSTDPQRKAGLAAMTAALVLRGADQDTLADLGASLSARADIDGAVVSLSAPEINIEQAAGLMAKVVLNGTSSAEEIERQRVQSLSEFSESMSQPRAIALRLIEPLLYGDAPYGRFTTEASLKSITGEDIRSWRRAQWRSDNATLVITGELDAKVGFELAAKLFGGWTPPAGPRAARAVPSKASGGGRVVVIDMPNSGQSAVFGFLPAIARGDPAYLPLSAGNIVLSKRLNEEIREKRGLSYGAGSFLYARRDSGHLFGLSQTKNESAAEVADLILGEIGKLGAQPIGVQELHNRLTFLAGNYDHQTETTQGLADAVAVLAEAGVPAAEVNRFVPDLMTTTPADVLSATSAKLPTTQASVLIVGDASKFLDALKKRHPNVEVLKLDDVRADPERMR